MANHFMQCGWPAWAVLALAAVGAMLGVVSMVLAIARRRGLAFAASGATLALALIVLAGGAAGRAMGRSMTDEVLALVDTAHREEIRAAGYGEAESCVAVAYPGAAVPGLLGVVGLIVAAVLRPRE